MPRAFPISRSHVSFVLKHGWLGFHWLCRSLLSSWWIFGSSVNICVPNICVDVFSFLWGIPTPPPDWNSISGHLGTHLRNRWTVSQSWLCHQQSLYFQYFLLTVFNVIVAILMGRKWYLILVWFVLPGSLMILSCAVCTAGLEMIQIIKLLTHFLVGGVSFLFSGKSFLMYFIDTSPLWDMQFHIFCTTL